MLESRDSADISGSDKQWIYIFLAITTLLVTAINCIILAKILHIIRKYDSAFATIGKSAKNIVGVILVSYSGLRGMYPMITKRKNNRNFIESAAKYVCINGLGFRKKIYRREIKPIIRKITEMLE